MTHRSGRRSPSSPLPSEWGTTGSATADYRRGSGNELRFAFGGLLGLLLKSRRSGDVPEDPLCHLYDWHMASVICYIKMLYFCS